MYRWLAAGALCALTCMLKTEAGVGQVAQQTKYYWNKTGADTEAITVGTAISLQLDSKHGSLSIAMVNAWDMYFRWHIDRKGGVLVGGRLRPLKLVMIDDESSNDLVKWATQRLIGAEGVKLFFAPYSSGLSGIAAPIVQNGGGLMLASGASSTSVFKNRSRIFGTLSSADLWLDTTFNELAAADGGARKSVMYLAENAAWTLDICKAVPAQVSKHGMDLLGGLIKVSDGAGEGEFTGVVANLTKQAPDIVVACVWRKSCHAMLRQMEKLRYTPKALVATICVTESDFVQELGLAGQFVIGMTPWHDSLPLQGKLTGDWTATTFASGYLARYAMVPPYQATAAFAAAAALCFALESANSTDPDAVATVLNNMSEDSVYGNVAFDKDGQATTSMKVFQTQLINGFSAMPMVYPQQVGAALVYPKPSWDVMRCFGGGGTKDGDALGGRRFGLVGAECLECPLNTIFVNVNAAAVPNATLSLELTKRFHVCYRLSCEIPSTFLDVASRTCKACPGGRYSPGYAETCSSCPTGLAVRDVGASECRLCDLGSYASNGSCVFCETGRFAAAVGVTVCEACPESFTTLQIASSSSSACLCPEGMFREGAGSVACQACPEGMTCAIGSDMRHFATARSQKFTNLAPGIVYPVLKAKYYSSAESPLHVFKCANEVRCPGGANWEKVCGEGAAGRSCAHCEKDWSPDGYGCIKCTDVEVSGILFPALPLILMPIAAVLQYYLFRDMPARWGSWKNGLSALIYVLLSHYQMAAMILDVPLLLPKQFSSALNIFESSADVVSLFNASCGGIGGFTKTFAMQSLIPIIFGIAVSVTFALSHVLSRFVHGTEKFAMEFDRTVNLYFSVLFAFFIGIASASFSLFKCQDNPSKDRTLTQDLSVICGDSEWNSILVVAILCILVYCAGCGTIYMIVIITAPKRFSTASFQKRWKFMFIKYNATAYWWSSVILAKGIVLALSSVVVRDPLGQLYWLMFTCMCYMALLAYFSPWRYKVADTLDMVVHLSIIALLSISTLFIDQSDKDIQENAAVGVFATVTSCSPFILFPLFFIALVRLPLEQKYLPTRYQRRRNSILATINAGCESLGHLKPEDVTSLFNNLEENDRRNFHALCVALKAELHDSAQNRLSNGLSLTLGQSVSERLAKSKSESRDDGLPALVAV